MKKLLLFLSFVSVAAAQQTAAWPQTVFNVMAGVNFSTIDGRDYDEYNSVVGFHGGLNAGINITAIGTGALYFQPGLMFVTKGHNYEYNDNYLNDEATWRLYYLEMPLMAMMKVPVTQDFAIAMNAGPYLALGLSGQKTYKWEDGFGEQDDGKINIFKDNKQMERVSRFDAGLGFGIGVEFKRVYFGVSYDLGLTDIAYNKQNVGGKNRTFSINLGYEFWR